MARHPKRYSFGKHLAWAIIIAAIGVFSTTGLVLTWLHPSSWVQQADLTRSQLEIQYIEPIAPASLSSATRNVPIGSSGDPLLGGINLGIDFLSYEYGMSIWDPNFQPWDPSTSELPTYVNLTRFRFGWPMRFLSYDDISTGATVNNPTVMAYHQRAYKLAGAHRGLDRPSWLPSFIPLYRVPIAMQWPHLGMNLLAWTLGAFALLAMLPLVRRWIRANRIKRGVCVVCKYPLEGFATCPECGTARE